MLTIKTPERCHLHGSGIFLFNFEFFLPFFLVSPLLPLNKEMLPGKYSTLSFAEVQKMEKNPVDYN